MKQEDKELLLKDLCARLPYEVKCKVWYNDTLDIKCTGIDFYTNIVNLDVPEDDNAKVYIDNVKPYLFPLLSMTEEQKEELKSLGWNFDNFEIHNVSECLGTYREYVAHSDCFTLIDWLNKNHFDYRGLIEKGLAIDATK